MRRASKAIIKSETISIKYYELIWKRESGIGIKINLNSITGLAPLCKVRNKTMRRASEAIIKSWLIRMATLLWGTIVQKCQASLLQSLNSCPDSISRFHGVS